MNEKSSAIRMLADQNIQFANPLPGVFTASLPISGCAWIDTGKGIVLIDTLLTAAQGAETAKRIRKPIKYIIYTHGHTDHVGGSAAFIKDNPIIIANQYLPDRLEKNRRLYRHRARITAQQFNIADEPEKLLERLEQIVPPTRTFLGDMTFSLGKMTFELHTARAETDDCCWIWVPEIRSAFIGDLIIGRFFPNVGNPWKPTRYPLGWIKTLEKIRVLHPDNIFCNGANTLFQGNEAMEALDANIEVIRSLCDQVFDCINQGMHLSEMIQAVKIPDHLKDSPYLTPWYSRDEFFVCNTYYRYHGWFDGNPANLLPRPEQEIKEEIFNLIGDEERILARAKDLKAQGKPQTALQVLDVLISAKPSNLDARRQRIELLETLGESDKCLMSRNAWVYFMEQDEAFVQSKSS